MNTLPIDNIIPQIQAAVSDRTALVLQAPPGSGKTTRVPLALLDVIPPEKGRIILVEPRRIAAVSAARWMAKSLGEEIGQTLGYSIRFDSRTSRRTRIEVVTEGILIRRILDDPALENVAMVIFDEFHERSLQTDQALALCLDICHGLREDLRLLVMSATMDVGSVASLLGGAAILQAEGSLFPVEEIYRAEGRDKPVDQRMAAAIRLALDEAKGDILAFLPGAGEIRRTASLIQESIAGRGAVSIHPLYGDLPFAEQEQAILPSPAGRRKIVLATNIAETSLTIEGVRIVLDSGLTRTLRYDPATGMNRLVTVPVSQAAALQRKGRAGRLGPGICYRLYSPHAFASLIPYAPPEMLVSDLSSLVLELSAWGVRDPKGLSWMDPPPAAAWQAARDLLFNLGALDAGGQVTNVGRDMARLPLHPRLARLLLKAAELECLPLGADLAALLSERDIVRRSDFSGMDRSGSIDITDRLERIAEWRRTKRVPQGTDIQGLQAVDRVSRQLLRLLNKRIESFTGEALEMVPKLLLGAYPDRIAMRRDEGGNRLLLRGGRGVRMGASQGAGLAGSPFIVAAHVDAGEKSEGTIHLAEPVPEALIRADMSEQIEAQRRVEWDRRDGRIVSILEERLGMLLLSSRPFPARDPETVPILCEAIRSGAAVLSFSKESRQIQGRVGLLKRAFPEESWPDLSDQTLLHSPESWLSPFLSGVRTQEQLAGLDVTEALRSCLSWEQRRLLDDRAPVSLVVPSGHLIAVDYGTGDVPVLAVKLQEMFGLADTPAIAGGRVKVLLHLLSPARRPLQITQDLRGFWDGSYHQVKKELKGRYPKHPWPDDPWNAVPTRRTK